MNIQHAAGSIPARRVCRATFWSKAHRGPRPRNPMVNRVSLGSVASPLGGIVPFFLARNSLHRSSRRANFVRWVSVLALSAVRGFRGCPMRVAVSSPRAVFLELAIERSLADAQDARGFFAIAVCQLERMRDEVPLDLVKRFADEVIGTSGPVGGNVG